MRCSQEKLDVEVLTYFIQLIRRVTLFFVLVSLLATGLGSISLAQSYTVDGYEKARTFLIRSASNNRYLRGEGRSARLRDFNPNDTSYLWVIGETGGGSSPYDRGYQGIFNVKTGLALQGTSGVGLRAHTNASVDTWTVEKNTAPNRRSENIILQTRVTYPEYGGEGTLTYTGLMESGSGVVVREGPTPGDFSDKKFIWRLELGEPQDLALIHIKSVKAIQTSTGTDGATDALMKGIELAAEYGPMVAGSGALSAVKSAAKTAAKEAGKKVAKVSLKSIAKKVKNVVLRQGTKSVAKKSGSGAIAKAARTAKTALTKKVKTVLKKKKATFLTYLRNPKKALTLKNLVITLKRTRSVTKKVVNADKIIEKLEQNVEKITDAAKLAKDLPVAIASQIAVSAVHKRVIADADKAALKLTQDLEKDFETYERLIASAASVSDRKLCDTHTPRFVYPERYNRNIVTSGSLSSFSKKAQAISEALAAAEAPEAAREAGEVAADVLLMNSGWIKRLLNPLIADTDDDLQIEFNYHDIWPNGGRDGGSGHRGIAKGERKSVNVHFLFNRQTGVVLKLIEWDYASDNDHLGDLRFSTSNLRDSEEYRDAFVMSKDEGSLYAVDFEVKSLNGDHRLNILADKSESACYRERKRAWTMERKVIAYEKALLDLEKEVERRLKLAEMFGDQGLNVIDGSLKLQQELSNSCVSKNIDFAKVMAGTWRVGHYDENLQKEYSDTWTYTFSDNVMVFTPKYYGTWKVKSDHKSGKWYSPTWEKDYSGERPWNNVWPDKIVKRGEQCGVFLQMGSRFDQRQENARGLVSEIFMPVELVGGKALGYHYQSDFPGNKKIRDIHRFAHTLDNKKNPGENLKLAKGDGPSYWLEKMDSPAGNPLESAKSIAKEKARIVGTWFFGWPSGAEKLDGWKYGIGSRWHFTSDNLVIVPSTSSMHPTVGAWEYIGDQRVQVTMRDAIFPSKSGNGHSQGKTTVLYMASPWNSEVRFYEAWDKDQLYTLYEEKEWHTRAHRREKKIIYDYDMEPEAQDLLEQLRVTKGLPTPTAELKNNKYTLAEMREQRAAKIIEDRARFIANAKAELLKENTETNVALMAKNSGQCAAGNGFENKWQRPKENVLFLKEQENLVGDWTVHSHDSRGNLVQALGKGFNWTFEAGGKVLGKTGGRSWTAKWAAADGCKASISFDDQTAKFFNAPNEVEVKVLFQKNGDKELYLINPATRASIGWAKQTIDQTYFNYEYANIKFTSPQLANRCSTRIQNGAIRSQNIPIEVDYFSVAQLPNRYLSEQGKTRLPKPKWHLFKTDFETPDAQYLGELPLEKLTTYKAFKGEEFVLLNEKLECAGIVDTTKPVAERRTLIQALETNNYDLNDVAFVVATVDNLEELSPTQIEKGCDAHRLVSSTALSRTYGSIYERSPSFWSQSTKKQGTDFARFIFNSGSNNIRVFPVIRTKDGAYSGAYESSKPLLTVEPGGTGVLNGQEYRKYTLLDSDDKCVGIIELKYQERYGYDFGDGSTPIKNPDYINPAARANGCLDLNQVSSARYSNNRTGGSRRLSNTGPTALRAFWVDYDGKYDHRAPVVTVEPGQTVELIDFPDNYFTVLDANNKCVAVKKLGVEGDGAAWSFGNGSVPVGPAKLRKIEPSPAPVAQQDYNEVQLKNGCDTFVDVASIPDKTGTMTADFNNLSSGKMTIHWASFYGKNENTQTERLPVATAILNPKGAAENTYLRQEVIRGDRFKVFDAAGQCVGVYDPHDGYQDQIDLRDKKQTDVISAKLKEDRRIKAEFDKNTKDWKKRHAEGQCGPDGILSAQDIIGFWKAGTFDQEGRRVVTDPTDIKRILQFNDTRGTFGVLSRSALPEAHCKLVAIKSHWTDTDLEVNFIFNPDGSKEFFTLREDGSLDVWAKLSPGLTRLKDVDPADNTVPEDAEVGAKVGLTVFSSDPDATVTYDFYSYKGESETSHDNLFAIDAKTGVVTLAGKVDRETAVSHSYYIRASSADGDDTSAEFTIKVSNVNEGTISALLDSDTGPASAYNGYRIENRLYETAPIGTRVGITAHAKDSDSDDVITYSLPDDAGGRFAIDPKTGVITVGGVLDWETIKTHTITAKASSSDGSSSKKQFTIILEDASEFELSEITDSDRTPNGVKENSPIGTTVGITVNAIDKDGSATVSYKIERSGDTFVIDPKTGVVSLAQPIDTEDYYQGTIDVVATSSDNSYSRKTFTIPFIDVDEFDVGEITDYWPERADEIAQNAKVGDKIDLTVQARDKDHSDTVSYSISNARLVPFQVDAKSGLVTVSRPFGKEERSNYSVDIVATSTDGSVSKRTFVVKVEDFNDFGVSAIADNDNARNVVKEDAKPGTPIGITAFATDADSSDTVTYSITNEYWPNGYTPLFAIDANSGVLTVGSGLDAETKLKHSIVVYAHSTDRSSKSATFDVKILDVNEHQIGNLRDSNDTENAVDENAAIGSLVGVTAFAEDRDVNDTTIYKLLDSDGGKFALDPKTGVISVAGPIDYETLNNLGKAEVRISAQSSDGSRNLWGDEQSFVIKVRDINEFSVSEVSDTDPNVNQVHEHAANGTKIGVTAFARDGDGDEFYIHKVKYELVDAAGNYTDGPFRVDYRTGVVTVYDLSKIDGETDSGSVVRIKATSDDGSSNIGVFNFNLIRVERWYNNPKGPRVEADFPKVTAADRAKCVAADDDHKQPATYNNEVEFFDCLERHTPVFINWYDNPQWPNILLDYPKVPQDAIDACYERNEDESLAKAFNNESEFVECLHRYVPPFVNWYDNPQWPNILSEYPLVPQDHIDQCYANNENENIKVAFNNEPEFVRCLQRYVPPFVNWYDDPQWPNILDEYPDVTDVHIDGCYTANENKTLTASFNNEEEFVRCLDRFVPPKPTFVNWYDNPQWPNILNEYPLVPTDHIDVCYDDNENESLVASFNNEVEFVRCLDRFVPPQQNPQQPTYIQRWYENPQGPYTEADFPNVSEADRDICIAEDDDVNAPATFNNEDAYFECLAYFSPAETPQQQPEQPQQPHQPTPVQRWYENPQGPYTEADFPNVSEVDRNICVAEDDDVNSPATYNNEVAYFECLAYFSPAAPTPNNDNNNGGDQGGGTGGGNQRPPALDPNLVAQGCYAEREPSQYLNDNETKLTIQNTGSSNLYVYWVNYEGQNTDYDNQPLAHSIVEPAESWDIEAARGFVFSILRPDGSCAGVAKTRESRNSFSFN